MVINEANKTVGDTRFLPALTAENRDFWTAGERDELRILRCKSCGWYNHPPMPVCGRCRSRDLKNETVSGRGIIASFTINHQPWRPDLPERFVIAIIELIEQPLLRLTTNIVSCSPDTVYIDMPVQVVFEQHEDIWLPLFQPVGQQCEPS